MWALSPIQRLRERGNRRPWPLRLRLTVWYTMSLALILLLFTTFLYYQVSGSLVAQVDAGLYLAANQALLGVENVDGRQTLQGGNQNRIALQNLGDDFIIQLLAADESVVAIVNNDDQIPRFSSVNGYRTQSIEGEPWRVYRQPVAVDGFNGFIQVAQELHPVATTLAGLLASIAWGFPLALLLAGLGGYFLAQRALRPIDRITRTAQTITAGDLGQRLHYVGPADEVGRLALTFDTMLDRLEGAFSRERRFTADAAHELRTPLTALKGRIAVTLGRPRPPAEYRATLTEMEEQVDRLIRLSHDLLFMARLDRGQVRPEPSPLALDEFLNAVVDQIRPLANSKGITLVTEAPVGLMLPGDIDLLIRLFLNLLDNAVKYTPANGKITVRARRQGDHVAIAVVDSGPGIAAEHLPHLFERFYRAEGDRGRTTGGAGLGLAIAREIARFHDGSISVNSTPDAGATFTVRLPLGDDGRATAAPESVLKAVSSSS